MSLMQGTRGVQRCENYTTTHCATETIDRTRQFVLQHQVRSRWKVQGCLDLRGDIRAEETLQQVSSTKIQCFKMRWNDAHFCGLNEEQKGELKHEKEETNDSQFWSWNCKPVVRANEACGNSFARKKEIPSLSRWYQNPIQQNKIRTYIWHVATNNFLSTESIHECLLKATVHLGNDHDENLKHVQNVLFENHSISTRFFAKLILFKRQYQFLCPFPTRGCVWRKWDPILLSLGQENFQ